MTNKIQRINKLEKILIVNDDMQDILAMQARLPENVMVHAASQWQARKMENTSGYDLIVVDNDANNLQESKGKETVQEIRTSNPDTPIIYTSFQPGWVPGEVYQTLGVQVIRTDQAIEEIAKQAGIVLREVQAKDNSKAPRLNIMLTYNTVKGYQAGIHETLEGERLLVVCFERRAQDQAKKILTEQVAKIYSDFDWRSDREIVKNIFVYDGINGGDWPGRVAQALGHDVRMKVNLLACGCDWERKQQLANSSYVDLYKVDCGGDREMGMIADVIMGIRRPNVDYDKLPMPKDKIKQGIEKFSMN